MDDREKVARRYATLFGWARAPAGTTDLVRNMDSIARMRAKDGVAGGDGKFGILAADPVTKAVVQTVKAIANNSGRQQRMTLPERD